MKGNNASSNMNSMKWVEKDLILWLIKKTEVQMGLSKWWMISYWPFSIDWISQANCVWMAIVDPFIQTCAKQNIFVVISKKMKCYGSSYIDVLTTWVLVQFLQPCLHLLRLHFEKMSRKCMKSSRHDIWYHKYKMILMKSPKLRFPSKIHFRISSCFAESQAVPDLPRLK